MITQKSFADFSATGETDYNGQLRILKDNEALENALRMWIASFRGEIIRQPDKGGYIVQWLTKPMSEDTRTSIKEAIEDGLFEDFQPPVQIRQLNIIPDYENQNWKIELKGYCPALRETFSLSEKLRRLSS